MEREKDVFKKMEPDYEQDVLCDLLTPELSGWDVRGLNHPHMHTHMHMQTHGTLSCSGSSTATTTGASKSSSSPPGLGDAQDTATGLFQAPSDARGNGARVGAGVRAGVGGGSCMIPRVATPIPGAAMRESYLCAVRELIDAEPPAQHGRRGHSAALLLLRRRGAPGNARKRRHPPSLRSTSVDVDDDDDDDSPWARHGRRQRRRRFSTRSVITGLIRPFRKHP